MSKGTLSRVVAHMSRAMQKCAFGHAKNVQIVCVEVLRPSQPNGVMSSVVNLPNHTFAGQA